jgi:NADPH:quinone reductase-like Zn-dependent oxidoreductase
VAKETAKVVRFHKAGGPEVLKIEEEAIPEPGKGAVRLNVKALGLNRSHSDLDHGQTGYSLKIAEVQRSHFVTEV